MLGIKTRRFCKISKKGVKNWRWR